MASVHIEQALKSYGAMQVLHGALRIRSTARRSFTIGAFAAMRFRTLLRATGRTTPVR
jgi:hypothetical protein